MSQMPAALLADPGLLKLALMRRGVRADPQLIEGRPDARSAHGRTLFSGTRDIDLTLPSGTLVSAPIAPTSPFELALRGGRTVLAAAGGRRTLPVRLSPRPRFYRHVTGSGVPGSRFATVHGPYLALSPTTRCTLLTDADRCRFCGVDATGGAVDVSVDDVVEAVRVARGERPVHVIHLSVGRLDGDDGGLRFLEPYVAAIKKHFDVLVAVDALPPADDRWTDRAYAMGADGLAYTLEIWDPARFAEICPGPSRTIGRDRFLDALAYATTVFPSGAVWSHLMVGLEPLASTRAGVAALAALGVMPVLPLYRPFKGRDLRADATLTRFEPSEEELVELYQTLWSEVRRRRLRLSLVRDLVTVTTPLDARAVASPPGPLSGWMRRLAGRGPVRRAAARMSDLRRALRVREVAAVEP